MQRRRAKIVVTPGSGEGRAMVTATRLRVLLRRRGWGATSQAFRDLDALARWACDTDPDFSHLICVGGDTTLSRAALLSIRTGIPFVETYRGFLTLTPTASPIDGMFDVFVIPAVSRFGLAWRLLKLGLRTPRRWRGVGLHRGRHAVVTMDGKRDEIVSVRRALPV